MKYRHIAITLLSVAAVSTAAAEIIPLAQTRTVDAYAYVSSPEGDQEDSASDAASDFGPFDGAAGASASMGSAFANMAAGQTSEIQPDLITASGSIGGSAEGWDIDEFGESNGESLFDLTFVVNFPSTFTLEGELGVFDSGSSSVTLIGPGGVTIYVNFGGFNETIPFSTSGELSGGQYQLIARTRASLFGDFSFPGYGSGNYDVALSITSTVSTDEATEPSVVELRLWPNPARGVVHIDGAGADAITVFDAAGRWVRSLTTSGGVPAVWDTRDGNGRRVSPGVYFVRSGDVAGGASRVLVTD